METGTSSESLTPDNNDVSTQIRRGQLETATKSLQRIIEGNPSGTVSLLSLLKLLFAMRARDPQTADKLFVEASVRMSGQQNVSADDALILGNYPFAPRVMDAKLLTAPRPFVSPILLGEIAVQADVAQVRPGVSPDATRTYLGAATLILERGSYDPDETKRRAAAAYQLLPHAQALAPNLVPRLVSIQRRADIDFASPSPASSLPLKETGKVDLNSVLESIDEIPTSKLRDQRILRTVRILYSKGDLDAAVTVGHKLSDLTGRNQLIGIITFAQGVKPLRLVRLRLLKRA